MDPLKAKFKEKATALSAEIKALLKEHGNTVIDSVTVGQAYGGMRDIKSMIWETSLLDAQEGIRFRGFTIPELQERLPTGRGKEPLRAARGRHRRHESVGNRARAPDDERL